MLNYIYHLQTFRVFFTGVKNFTIKVTRIESLHTLTPLQQQALTKGRPQINERNTGIIPHLWLAEVSTLPQSFFSLNILSG